MAFGMVPGAWVRLPGRPDWGIGQIQSAVDDRVTVMFEHGGKQLIRTDVVNLEATEPPTSPGT
ncbi:hypothetical protein CKO38_09225 [Rhodospirillum rubrum]|uniref:DUF3553 domain-containing protein n=1 Tax=Rhodospirillum rubrum TaxID=1085 RepID=UPI0019062818|nr:DUF3553 domain-containing protein [Rhodospirillum rubrum]MBK1664903.1 hypothetical protein [Rhodospirillum rubrum]MBK1676849.1 hypothetical protein [Rhodospirillum rubrum]